MVRGFNETDLLPIIGRFYEAAGQPELWPAVLHELSLATGAGGGMIHGTPTAGMGVICSEGVAELTNDFLADDWVKLNPRPARGLAIMPTSGGIVTDEMCFTPREMSHLPFHADLIARHGFRSFAGLVMGQTANATLLLSLERRVSQGPFLDHEIETLRKLAPHLQAAGRLSLQLAETRAIGLAEGFDLMKCGAFLLDGHGLVSRLNTRAEAHLGQYLSLSAGRLSAKDKSTNELLQALISDVILAPSERKRPSLTVTVPRVCGLPLIISGASVNGSVRDIFRRTIAILTVNDPDVHRDADVSLLRQLFGLTAAEARIANYVGRGYEPSEISRLNGVKESTIRTQLSMVFNKMGIRRQAELTALLSRLSRDI